MLNLARALRRSALPLRRLASSARQADLVEAAYLREIAAFRYAGAEKPDLPTSFAAGVAPPPKPAVEQPTAFAAPAAQAAKDWPEIKNPVDDPEEYDANWDYTTETPDFKPREPIDYHH